MVTDKWLTEFGNWRELALKLFPADCGNRQSISSHLVVSRVQLSFFVKIELTYFFIPSLTLHQYRFIVGWNLHLWGHNFRCDPLLSSELSWIWRELALHYFCADHFGGSGGWGQTVWCSDGYLRFGGNWDKQIRITKRRLSQFLHKTCWSMDARGMSELL